jgi:hypothetical protein
MNFVVAGHFICFTHVIADCEQGESSTAIRTLMTDLLRRPDGGAEENRIACATPAARVGGTSTHWAVVVCVGSCGEGDGGDWGRIRTPCHES